MKDRLARITRKLERDPELLARVERWIFPPPPDVLSSPRHLESVFGPLLFGLEEERFAILALDVENRLIDSTVLTVGSHQLVVVDNPSIVRWLMTRTRPTSAFAVAHNHPSSHPVKGKSISRGPSKADKDITFRLRLTAMTVGIDFVDHLILFQDGTWFSFRENDPDIEYIDGGESAGLKQCVPSRPKKKKLTVS